MVGVANRAVQRVVFLDPGCCHCRKLSQCFKDLGGESFLEMRDITVVAQATPESKCGVYLFVPDDGAFPHAFEFPANVDFRNGMEKEVAKIYFVGENAHWMSEAMAIFNSKD